MNGPFFFGTKRPDHKLTAYFCSVRNFKIQGMFFPSPLYTYIHDAVSRHRGNWPVCWDHSTYTCFTSALK